MYARAPAPVLFLSYSPSSNFHAWLNSSRSAACSSSRLRRHHRRSSEQRTATLDACFSQQLAELGAEQESRETICGRITI